jgi:ribosomal protein S18 acetylase RimI-like enzyme
MGIGEDLTCKVINQAVAEGAPELVLLVGEDNLSAIRLYAKLGFKKTVVPELQEQLEEERRAWGMRRVLMRKVLSG